MNYYKKSLLCLGMALALLTSCEKHDEIPQVPPPDQGEDNGQHPLPPVELQLTLDLEVTLPRTEEQSTTVNEFTDEVTAVALLRRTGDREMICLPLTLTRSTDDPRKAGISDQKVAFGALTADADKKWQIRVLTGGRWDAASRQLQFDAPDRLTPSRQAAAVRLSQPAVSAWQEIPTDQNGQFIPSDKGTTPLSVEVTPQALLLSHHITSCDAESDVVVERLTLGGGEITLGGYYDLSDSKASADALPTWHGTSIAEEGHALDFTTPLTVPKGEETVSEDYVYLWVMPQTGEPRIKVEASGHLLNDGQKKFDRIVTFNDRLPAPQKGVTHIGSKIYIEYTRPIEGPITLGTLSDKTTIIADGKDEVTFVIRQSGVDVTRECTIYRVTGIFEEELPSAKFKTSREGVYEFYAVKAGERSNHIRIQANRETATDPDGNLITGTKFVRNVSPASGWHDVNKVGDGNSHIDGLLCWAAASSNILQWWLEDFKKQGHELPARVPFGAGSRYELAIFDTFFDCWINYMHSTRPGIRWFMEGGGMQHAASNGSSPNKGGTEHEGGYFRGVLSQEQEDALFGSDYVEEIGAYSGWVVPSREEGVDMHLKFSQLFMRLIDEGATALSIDSHELTAWGYDVTDGLVTRIYVTNSDDGGRNLASYKVAKRGDDIHLIDYPGKTSHPTQIIRFTRMKAYGL